MSSNNLLTPMQIGRMEVVLLQASYDYYIQLINEKFIMSSRGTNNYERLMLKDAFNECFKHLKRHIVGLSSKEQYNKLIDYMADKSDELDNAIKTLYNCYYGDCVKQFKYEHCNALALNLVLHTLLRLSNEITCLVRTEGNKYIKNILKSLDEFSKTQKALALNNDLKFNNEAIKTLVTKIIETTQKITEYEVEN